VQHIRDGVGEKARHVELDGKGHEHMSEGNRCGCTLDGWRTWVHIGWVAGHGSTLMGSGSGWTSDG
jgi:hypothetical protein